MADRIKINEDWLSFIIGFVLLAAVLAGLQFTPPSFKWSDAATLAQVFSPTNLLACLYMLAVMLAVGATTLFMGAVRPAGMVAGVVLIFALSVLAQVVAGYHVLHDLGIEYVIVALLLGILFRAVSGVPSWLKPALQSEFFIKIGLVLLGTGIIFNDIVEAGSLGLIQAIVVVLAVWYFTFWIARKFRVDDELGIMLSSAVSICGVSAAIATCGAIQGDGKKLSYVVSLVLIVALPMMVVMPPLANLIHLPPEVAGAWIGGTIDTTGAVVATGAQLGERALKVSTIVKLSQNVLLGLAAVAISFFWMMRSKAGEAGNKPQWALIWQRFPKFVLGFLLASVLFSFFLSGAAVANSQAFIKGIRTALFALAFVCIGLETDLSVLIKTGNGRPAAVFIIAQVFNVLLTLVVAYILFGGHAV